MTELATAITAKEFSELKLEDKIQIILDERQADLDNRAAEESRQQLCAERDAELKAFDEDAINRIGKLQSLISNERTVIEKKWQSMIG